MLFNQLREFTLSCNQLVEISVRFGKLVVHRLVFLEDIDDLLHAFFHYLADSLVVVELWLLVEHAYGVAG